MKLGKRETDLFIRHDIGFELAKKKQTTHSQTHLTMAYCFNPTFHGVRYPTTVHHRGRRDRDIPKPAGRPIQLSQKRGQIYLIFGGTHWDHRVLPRKRNRQREGSESRGSDYAATITLVICYGKNGETGSGSKMEQT